MGRVRTRRALTVGAAVLAAAAAGCGGDDDKAADKPAAQAQPPAATATTPAPSADTATTPAEPAVTAASADSPIARAAKAVRAHQGGLSVSLRGTIQSKGTETTVTGKGSIDRGSQRGSFTSKTGIGNQKVVVRQVMDGKAVYLTSDFFKGRLPGGKSWMKIDLAEAAKAENFDLSAFGTNGPSQDPSQVLDYLAGAGNVKKVGTETVRGVKATRYRVTVDLARAKAQSSSKSAKAAIQQLLATLDGKTTVPADVWIDGKDRVLRERVRYTAEIKGQQNAMDFTTDFTGFDVRVDADPPSGSDTVDGLELLRKAEQAREQAGASGSS